MQPAEHIINPTWLQHRSGQQVSPLLLYLPFPPHCSSPSHKQLTRKTSPTGPRLRPHHRARPRDAAALRKAAISRPHLRPPQRPHLLPSHTSNLSHINQHPQSPRFPWRHHYPLTPGMPGRVRHYPQLRRPSNRPTPHVCKRGRRSSFSPSYLGHPPSRQLPPSRRPLRARDAAAL